MSHDVSAWGIIGGCLEENDGYCGGPRIQERCDWLCVFIDIGADALP